MTASTLRSLASKPALRGLALAFVYLFLAQIALSPLAALRMEARAAIFGVVCSPGEASDAPARSSAAACCDAACLLHAQGASAPPAPAAFVDAPARLARFAAFVATPREAGRPFAAGLRPQSQRAPPFA
ncbi:MAG: hypothetical protein HZY79_02125 [Rhodoblastus sp.]|nr:MAG: hypothetical protein HZY79_02125 [Rhodoblastus sp.]